MPKETDQTAIFWRKRKTKELKATKTKPKEEHEYDFSTRHSIDNDPAGHAKRAKEIHWKIRR